MPFTSQASIIIIYFTITSFFVGPVHAQYTGRINYDAFKSGCLRECVQREDRDYCGTYCECGATQMRDKSDTNSTISKSQIDKIMMGCHGTAGITVITARCLNSICKAGAKCKEVCSCLAKKLKTIGSPAEIGEFFRRFSRNDQATKSKLGGIYMECNSPH